METGIATLDELCKDREDIRMKLEVSLYQVQVLVLVLVQVQAQVLVLVQSSVLAECSPRWTSAAVAAHHKPAAV